MGLTIKKVGRFLNAASREKILLLEALGCMLAQRVRMLRLRELKCGQTDGSRSVDVGMSSDAEAVCLAVSRVAAVFGAKCLLQALTAQKMLARRGIPCALQLGVDRDLNTFGAHAWIEVGGTAILGGKQLSNYQAFK